MTLISTDKLEINESGIELSDKYPELVGSPKTIILQAEEIYYVNVGYNLSTNNLYIKILDSNNEIIQGVTDLIEYPQNLLQSEKLLNYFLFFKGNKFYFGSLDNFGPPTKNPNELIEEWDNAVL